MSAAALTVAAHGAAGGALPEAGLPVLFTVLLAGAGTAVADRRQGVVGIALTLGAAQFGQHVLLSLLGHAHPGTAGAAGVTSSADVDTAGAAVGSQWMLLAHVLAALLTALLLARAEAAVFAIAAALALLLPRRLTPAPAWAPLRLPTRSLSWGNAGGVLEVLLRRVHGRRGPPRSGMAITRIGLSYPQPPELSTG